MSILNKDIRAALKDLKTNSYSDDRWDDIGDKLWITIYAKNRSISFCTNYTGTETEAIVLVKGGKSHGTTLKFHNASATYRNEGKDIVLVLVNNKLKMEYTLQLIETNTDLEYENDGLTSRSLLS